MRLAARLAITVLAVGLVFGMGVHYDIAEDRHWPYPNEEQLAANYDALVGERTLLWGTVESVDSSAAEAVIAVEHDGGTLTLTVTDFGAQVERGGVVQVFGTIEPGRTIAAERVVVVNPSGGSELAKFAVSGIGAIVVLVVFFRHWIVEWKTVEFEAR